MPHLNPTIIERPLLKENCSENGLIKGCTHHYEKLLRPPLDILGQGVHKPF